LVRIYIKHFFQFLKLSFLHYAAFILTCAQSWFELSRSELFCTKISKALNIFYGRQSVIFPWLSVNLSPTNSLTVLQTSFGRYTPSLHLWAHAQPRVQLHFCKPHLRVLPQENAPLSGVRIQIWSSPDDYLKKRFEGWNWFIFDYFGARQAFHSCLCYIKSPQLKKICSHFLPIFRFCHRQPPKNKL
jgi:hypothetical protein